MRPSAKAAEPNVGATANLLPHLQGLEEGFCRAAVDEAISPEYVLTFYSA
jgi:hypothetical protein